MGSDRHALTRPTDVSLKSDLVRLAHAHNRNPSVALENLLDDFEERERARRRDDDLALDRTRDGFKAFHREHGLLSDEFSWL